CGARQGRRSVTRARSRSAEGAHAGAEAQDGAALEEGDHTGLPEPRADATESGGRLEHEFQAELENPRIARARIGAGDPAERRRVVDRRVRDFEVPLDEDVEELHPRLNIRRAVEA